MAGVWCIGRLQTDADRGRVVDGLRHGDGSATSDLAETIPRLAKRWFVIRNAHEPGGPRLLQPRWSMSLLRGPMTREELQRARAVDVWCTAPSVLPRSSRAVGLRGLRPVPELRPRRHRPVFAFLIVDVNAKHVVHVGVTRAPTEQWTAQQLREATPFGKGPQVLVRDRDAKYGPVLDRVAEGVDIEVVLTAPCTPRMNVVVERFLGGVRRECLDHVIILGENHVRCVLNEYARSHFNEQRPHQGLEQRIPLPRTSHPSDEAGKVVAFPVLNGLHHHCQRVA